jgi:hypothetical protein
MSLDAGGFHRPNGHVTDHGRKIFLAAIARAGKFIVLPGLSPRGHRDSIPATSGQ